MVRIFEGPEDYVAKHSQFGGSASKMATGLGVKREEIIGEANTIRQSLQLQVAKSNGIDWNERDGDGNITAKALELREKVKSAVAKSLPRFVDVKKGKKGNSLVAKFAAKITLEG